MWKKIFAASAVAVGVAGILGSGSVFASYIVSDSYTPGLGLPISGDNDVCVRKSGGYDGDLIVADIRGTNYEKQVVFDHFAEDRICVSVDSVPESSNLKFVVPMGLGDMSYTLSGDNGQNRVILDLSDATSVNKYVRSYGNTTTRTAKSVATITLDTNGGTGIVPMITGIEIGSSVTLPSITLTRTGYNFAGWNTKADGTGTPYSNGATIPVTKAGELVLFAQWQGRAVLDRGEVVNGRLKHLAGTEAASGVSIVYQNDYNIKAIKKASALPEGFNTSSAANIISASTATSPERIYAWYDNSDGDNDGDGDGAIYIFSGADIIEAGSDMSYMFENMRSLSDISAVSDWDTSAAENMTGVFIGDSSLSNIDAVASWNTSNVYTLSAIFMSTNFANADALRTMRHESKDYVSWDVSGVKNMYGIFAGNTSLVNISALASWDTSSAKDMSYTFFRSTSLVDISALASWNTSSVTNMSRMFCQASSLTYVSDLSGWDTANVTNMSEMFDGASALISMTLPDSFVISSGTNAADMFNGVSNTAILCATDPTVRSLWPGIYCGTTKLQSGQNVNAAIKQLAGDEGARFSDENTSIKTIKFVDELPSGINPNTTAKVNIGLDGLTPVYAYWNGDGNVYIDSEAETIYANENSSSMFQNFTRLTAIDFSDIFNTSKTTNMWLFFFGDAALTSLTLPSSFDTSKVTTMQQMFQNVSSLTTLNLPTSFNTSNVRNMNFMFAGMARLTTLTFSNSFNTKNVENMAQMFQGMTSLATLNLPESFNTSKVTTMQQMFLRCEALTSLTLPAAFDTSKVSDMQQMFLLTSSLTKLTLPDAFVVKSGANTNGIFATTSSTAVLYATDATIRSLWPGVLGN